MDKREIVAAKLGEVGVNLRDDDLAEVATAYTAILKWQGIVDSLLNRESEPAVIFKAKTGDLS